MIECKTQSNEWNNTMAKLQCLCGLQASLSVCAEYSILLCKWWSKTKNKQLIFSRYGNPNDIQNTLNRKMLEQYLCTPYVLPSSAFHFQIGFEANITRHPYKLTQSCIFLLAAIVRPDHTACIQPKNSGIQTDFSFIPNARNNNIYT